jgi:hypothetical protein
LVRKDCELSIVSTYGGYQSKLYQPDFTSEMI